MNQNAMHKLMQTLKQRIKPNLYSPSLTFFV